MLPVILPPDKGKYLANSALTALLIGLSKSAVLLTLPRPTCSFVT
jgi:hypothetical protein